MIVNQNPYKIDFDMKLSQTLTCRYGETGRQYKFNTDIDLTGLSANLQVIKPDNTFVIEAASVVITEEEQYIVVEIPLQATVVKGVCRYDINIYDDDDLLLYTAEGPMWVDDQLITEDMIESAAEVYGLRFPQDFLTVENLVDIVNYVKAEIEDQLIPEALPEERGYYLRADQDTGVPEWSPIDDPLPEYGPSDAGKSLTVNSSGTDVEWDQIEMPLPEYGPSDAGKSLTVNNAGTDVEWQKAQHIYSTQEQVVGKWTDGRNVYERTFEISTTSPLGTNTYAFNHGISDLDRMINYHGSSYWPGGAGGQMIPTIKKDGTFLAVGMYNPNIFTIELSDNMAAFGGAYYIVITVQYIKTS